MLQFGRRVRIGVAVGLSVLLPASAPGLGSGVAWAGDLKAPTIAASVAAAADWASTYHALKHYELREANPLLRPLDRRPGTMITVGALMDAGLVSTWNLTVGRKNERVAVAGLWAMTAFRAYLTIHNLRNERKVARR